MNRLYRLVRPRNATAIAFVLFAFGSIFPCRVAAQSLSNGGQGAVIVQSGAPTSPNAAVPTDAAVPAFEVASVKKHANDSDGGRGMRVMMGGPDVSQFRASNVTAKMLIATAYSVKEFQIAGGPSWINSERWDIDAKVEDSLAAELKKLPRQEQQAQQALMLRPLLADRFKLQITRSTKESNVLALVVAKGGPKLKEVPAPDLQAAFGPPPVAPARGDSPVLRPGGAMMTMGTNGLATLKMSAVPMSSLVNLLSLQVGQQVVDQTGLTGHYDMTLQFSGQGLGGFPAVTVAGDSPNANADNGAPSLFTALQEQVGLKLESAKGPVDTIAVDHIEEPSEN